MNETIKEALRAAKIDPKDVRGIGVSGQQHGLVPLDGDGRVIRPAKLWNDTSTIRECEILIRRLGGKITAAFKSKIVIPHMFSFHRKLKREVEVEVYRIERVEFRSEE